MNISIKRQENKRITVLPTGEGFFANIDLSGEHLKNLEHNASQKGINLEQLLQNEVSCAFTRLEESVL